MSQNFLFTLVFLTLATSYLDRVVSAGTSWHVTSCLNDELRSNAQKQKKIIWTEFNLNFNSRMFIWYIVTHAHSRKNTYQSVYNVNRFIELLSPV